MYLLRTIVHTEAWKHITPHLAICQAFPHCLYIFMGERSYIKYDECEVTHVDRFSFAASASRQVPIPNASNVILPWLVFRMTPSSTANGMGPTPGTRAMMVSENKAYSQHKYVRYGEVWRSDMSMN